MIGEIYHSGKNNADQLKENSQEVSEAGALYETSLLFGNDAASEDLFLYMIFSTEIWTKHE